MDHTVPVVSFVAYITAIPLLKNVFNYTRLTALIKYCHNMFSILMALTI